MRILSVSDKVEPVLYGPHIRERVGKIDLILACGDLPYYYLEYIVGLLDARLYLVHGNHDSVAPSEPVTKPALYPTGISWAENLHMRTINHNGLLLAGLEGCRMYSPGMPYQYSEGQVKSQVFWLGWLLRSNRLRLGRYLDILITHAPPRGIHDGEDPPHRGFESYLRLLRRFRPMLMIHGHQHVYNRCQVTETEHAGTRIINTYGYRIIEIAARADGCGWELVRSSC